MSFTDKQREIVARKLGYEGPMQGFDEFLNSSPALQTKYNMVSDKYVQKMATGGVVAPQATSIDDNSIRAFFMQNKDNPAALRDAAKQYGISNERAATALGVDVGVLSRYVG